eukprot:6704357-Lingulodinium_polyedra.AAC.1
MLCERVTVRDITTEDDFTVPAICDQVMEKLTGPCDALFYSSPCTGGCPWQRINRAKAVSRGCVDLIQKLDEHVNLHRRLWSPFHDIH